MEERYIRVLIFFIGVLLILFSVFFLVIPVYEECMAKGFSHLYCFRVAFN